MARRNIVGRGGDEELVKVEFALGFHHGWTAYSRGHARQQARLPWSDSVWRRGGATVAGPPVEAEANGDVAVMVI